VPHDPMRIELDPELVALIEGVARHVHDAWVRVRLDQGWTVGPTRDDASKRHPCLVPYEELDEADKIVDRETAKATLQATIALGFVITRPE
jgi:hypothetical protein